MKTCHTSNLIVSEQIYVLVPSAKLIQDRSAYGDCFSNCFLPYYPPTAATCAISCAFRRRNLEPTSAKMGIAFEDAGNKPSTHFVAECTEKCIASYESADPNLAYCLIGCSLGGQRHRDEEGGAVSLSARTTQARGFDSCMANYCYYVSWTPAAAPCMAVCMAAGGRSGSIDFSLDEMSPVTGIDYKPATFDIPDSSNTPAQPINPGQFLVFNIVCVYTDEIHSER